MSENGALQMWTIYERPRDLPDFAYVVRGWTIRPGECIPDGQFRVADDLEGARCQLPATADTMIPRQPNDDPKIVEVWM